MAGSVYNRESRDIPKEPAPVEQPRIVFSSPRSVGSMGTSKNYSAPEPSRQKAMTSIFMSSSSSGSFKSYSNKQNSLDFVGTRRKGKYSSYFGGIKW